MFTSLLVLVPPLVSALTINTPTGVTSGEMFNISWVTVPGDPTSWNFVLFQALDLVNYLQHDVNSSLDVIGVLCPFVPPSDGYIVEALDNTNAKLALSATFSIAAANSSSGSSTAVSATGTDTNTVTSTVNSLPVTSSTSVSGGSSSSTGTGTDAASTSTNPSSNPSPNSSTTTQREAIIGGVIGGLVLISILLALFFFNRRRNNRRSQALREKSYTDPSLDVVNPFTVPSSNPTPTFLPQNHTSNGQSLPSQPISSKFTQRVQPPDAANGQSLPSHAISSKFTQRGQPSDAANTSSSGPPLIPLLPQISSPAFISPSSSRLPLTGSQTNLDGTPGMETEVPRVATEPSRQRSPSPRANTRYLRHEDSGVRIPPVEDDVVESPPFYTP